MRYNSSMSKKILPIILLLPITLLAYLFISYPHTSVLKSSYYLMNHIINPHAKLNKHVMGFLPYWHIDNMQYVKPEMLSEINYFGLTAGKDGKLLTIVDNQTDPGWREWNRESTKDFVTKSKIMGTEVSLTVTAQKNKIIESLLDSPTSQATLVSQILEQIKTRSLNGINIDFEYLGDVDKEYKNKFTDFTKLLHEKIQKESPKTKLSLSIMPLAGREKDLFDLKKIAPYFDRFIGMSYDYYGASSEIAGPVAPMKGFKENKYFFDVQTSYEDYLKVVPKEKIIMGIPYYGWDFAVVDGKKIQSKTFPQDDPKNYAAVMSYGRMKESADLKPNQCQWDDYALATWCWYTKDDVDHQVWLEDNKSLGIKFDFAEQKNLGGIAIWVLGYDKDYPDLWNMLKGKFGEK